MKFRVYAKDVKDAQPIELEFPRGFRSDGQFLRPLNSAREPSAFAVLNTDNIAAVLPETFGEQSQQRQATEFDVFIKGRREPLKVKAHLFDASAGASVQFQWIGFDSNKFPEIKRIDIPNVYVAISEVVAIYPVGGIPPNLE